MISISSLSFCCFGVIIPPVIKESTIPIDLFCAHVKKRVKVITITTPTSSTSCKIKFEAIYQNVISFPSLPLTKEINFGMMPLTSLTTVEEKKSFDVVNVSDKQIYLCVSNEETRHVVLYEHDPDFPIMSTISLEPAKLTRINLRLKPNIELTRFKKYSTFVLNDSITIKAFLDPDDATNASLHKQEDTGCIFQAQIPVKAFIGRVGLSLSDKVIDFGCVDKTTQVARISVKNKSSRIPLEVFCACSQGLTVDSPRFTIPGQKESKDSKEIEITFKPTVEGLNTGKILFTVAQTSIQLEIEVFAFVDPHNIEIALPRNERGYYSYDIGEVYLNGDTPIQKRVSFQAKNISQITMIGDIAEVNKTFFIRPGNTSEISFMGPPYDNIDEERQFSFPIHFRGKMTKAIQQIVEITGRFIISSAQATSSVELGTIITSDETIKTTLDFNIVNNARCDLYLDLALTNRPDLKAYREKLKISEYELYRAYGSFLPVISLFTNYSYSSNSTQNAGNNPTGFGNFYVEGNSFNYGLAASLTLFNGGIRYNRIREARSELTASELAGAELWLKVVNDVRSAYANCEYSRRIMEICRENQKLMAEQRELVMKEYLAGEIEVTRLNEAQTNLVHSNMALADAVIKLHKAHEQLAAAVHANGTAVR